MSILLGVWGSNFENEVQPIHEGITQQPGSFYNGNPSSSIWGNPPTPPLWRDMPSPNPSCFSSCEQPLALSSSFSPAFSNGFITEQQPQQRQWQCHLPDKHPEQMLDKSRIMQSDKEEAEMSRTARDYTSSQARPQEASMSPFSFGFPPPSSSSHDPGFLDGSSSFQFHFAGGNADLKKQKSRIYGRSTISGKSFNQCSISETPYSEEELIKRWESMLRLQCGGSSPPHPSTSSYYSSTFTPSVWGSVSSKGIGQPVENSHGAPVSDAGVNTVPLFKQQSTSQVIGNASVDPIPANWNGVSLLSSQKEGSDIFVFGTSARAGVSRQKIIHPSAAGSLPRSGNIKVKKHSNQIKGKSSAAPGASAFCPMASKSSTDASCFNNAGPNFTVEASCVSGADCSQCSDVGTKIMNSTDSKPGPGVSLQPPCVSESKVSSSYEANRATVQSPSCFEGPASTVISADTQSVKNFSNGCFVSQRNELQHSTQMQSFGEHFGSWHPFTQNTEGYLMKNSEQASEHAWNSSIKGTCSRSLVADETKEKWMAGSEAASPAEEFAKTSPVPNRKAVEGSKLAEFDLNSPSKPLVEELRERVAKLGRCAEEMNRQKENQEPNFIFGSQKVPKPFVFRASRSNNPPNSTKNASLNADDASTRGSNENKVFEHLVEELGEKMAKLGRSIEDLNRQSDDDANQTRSSAVGTKGSNSFEHSVDGFCENLGKSDEEANRQNKVNTSKTQCSARRTKERCALNHSIKELREQLSKLGRFDEATNRQNDKASKTECSARGTQDFNAIEHSVEELREQIAKLGKSDEELNKQNQERNAIEHSIEELRNRIAKLGKSDKEMNKQNHDSATKSKCSASGIGKSDVSEQSVEERCEQIAKLGKSYEKTNKQGRDQEPASKSDRKEVHEAFVFSASKSSNPMANPSKESDNSGIFLSAAYAGNSSGVGFVNAVQTGPFSTYFHPILDLNNSFVGAPLTCSFPTSNSMNAGQSSPFTEAHNEAPIGEFSGPVSSTESSVSESSPTRGHAADQSSHHSHSFEFQGSMKGIQGSMKGIHTGLATRKKNAGAFSNVRRHDRQNATRPKKRSVSQGKIYPISTRENTGSRMDSLPCVDEVAPSSLKTGSDEAQQAPVGQSTGPKSDDVESPSVEGLRAADANISIGKEEGDVNSKGDHDESGLLEHSNDQTGPHISHQRKGKWKRVYMKEYVPTEKGGTSVQTASKKTNQFFTYSKMAEEYTVLKAASIPGEHFDFGFPRSSTSMKSAAAEQVCQGWRLRGNQAYANGDFQKAEDCYSRGAGSVSPDETSQNCIRASMLCYSNRAATRMGMGRMREALADCRRAMVVDFHFPRVRLRAASCHLALGESNAAASLFKECLKYAKENSSSDPKIADEAMEGVRKSQLLETYLERASKLSQGENSTHTTAALGLLNEALLISPYSEPLLELKAQVLFILRRFEDVVQLCQQSLPSAEENHANEQHHDPSVRRESTALNLWRWRMCGKSFFHLGMLEDSLNLLIKHEETTLANPTNKASSIDSMATLVSSIRDLLQHKAAGNEAFQAGRHAEAVEHYTAALACNGESRPYNAVCFCNRAAASQALGHIADAIADCSRAIVLDPNYPKPISRRATLHGMVGDYGQTCSDLRRLIALLEGQESHSKNSQSTRAGPRNAQDLRQARDRLEKANDEVKKSHVVDHYLILGLDAFCSANDVKKAYRKAALKHHPDKAGQFLVRGENGDDGSLWKEVGDEVRRDAERLFKLIGEAYGVLSDPIKRLQYDTEEHHKSRAKNATNSGSATTDEQCFPHEKTGRRHRGRGEAWNGYSPQYQRWQSGPDAAQPDTYSRRGTRASSGSKSSRNTEFYWREI